MLDPQVASERYIGTAANSLFKPGYYVFNPAASGIVARVNRILVASQDTGFFEVFIKALSVDPSGLSSTMRISNKRIGGPAPTCLWRRQNDIGGTSIARVGKDVQGFVMEYLEMDPIIIPQGAGVAAQFVSIPDALTECSAAFEWEESPI